MSDVRDLIGPLRARIARLNDMSDKLDAGEISLERYREEGLQAARTGKLAGMEVMIRLSAPKIAESERQQSSQKQIEAEYHEVVDVPEPLPVFNKRD